MSGIPFSPHCFECVVDLWGRVCASELRSAHGPEGEVSAVLLREGGGCRWPPMRVFVRAGAVYAAAGVLGAPLVSGDHGNVGIDAVGRR